MEDDQMEDDPHGRWTKIEDDPKCRLTLYGRWPNMEDEQKSNITQNEAKPKCNGWGPKIEDVPKWKMTTIWKIDGDQKEISPKHLHEKNGRWFKMEGDPKWRVPNMNVKITTLPLLLNVKTWLVFRGFLFFFKFIGENLINLIQII